MQSVLGGNIFDLDAVRRMRLSTVQGKIETNLTSASFSLSESTCASSDGGPGLNFGEQIAGRSMLGTISRFNGCQARSLD